MIRLSTAQNVQPTQTLENSHIDGIYSLNFYILSALVADGTKIYLRETHYEYDRTQLSDTRNLYNMTNIFNIIYHGILDSLIRPDFSIHLANLRFVPGPDLSIRVVPEEHKVEFHGPDGHYFSLVLDSSGGGTTSVELGQLGHLLVQKKRQYNILHVTSQPTQKLLVHGRDFIEYLHHQILKQQLLIESLRLVAGFRYFYKYRMPIDIHVTSKNTEDPDEFI